MTVDANSFLTYLNVSEITPYVFVTAEDTARQYQKIFSNGIACVINVADELPQMVFPPQSGIESLKFPIQDYPNFPVSNYFDIVADRIAANAAARRRTLLYCHYGRSRSITFTLAYLIKHYHLPLPVAFALVKQRRQVALPNVGFWSQLKSYELQHQQKFSLGVLNNFQSTLNSGQQALSKLAGGIQQFIFHNSIVHGLTNSFHPGHPKPTPYHAVIRRRTPYQLPLSYRR